MTQIKQIIGTGVPVIGNDIDTDRIIPARFLRCVTFDGLGKQAFADDRVQTKGKHPFDLPQYQDANILVVNNNFGCGSSREHAPQALARWGIKAIVGESFAEIFFGNCVAIGLPCVTCDRQTVEKLQTLLTNTPQTNLNIDLEAMKISCEGLTTSVSMDEGSRQRLLTGTWDNCSQLISSVEQIKATTAQLPYLQWQTS
ncbi:MAG: 3-isopropylmalate dehydratase small subunit [Xenococcaceae cyanobacterium MO_188.B32]|nr:3-isopropylmalate dehydratase small subunit [Xenococcaceae cyanobacterium MO_188.B32]